MTDNVFTAFVRNAQPQPNPDNIIQGDRWRICLLTDALARFEWSDTAISRTTSPKPCSTATSDIAWNAP